MAVKHGWRFWYQSALKRKHIFESQRPLNVNDPKSSKHYKSWTCGCKHVYIISICTTTFISYIFIYTYGRWSIRVLCSVYGLFASSSCSQCWHEFRPSLERDAWDGHVKSKGWRGLMLLGPWFTHLWCLMKISVEIRCSIHNVILIPNFRKLLVSKVSNLDWMRPPWVNWSRNAWEFYNEVVAESLEGDVPRWFNRQFQMVKMPFVEINHWFHSSCRSMAEKCHKDSVGGSDLVFMNEVQHVGLFLLKGLSSSLLLQLTRVGLFLWQTLARLLITFASISRGCQCATRNPRLQRNSKLNLAFWTFETSQSQLESWQIALFVDSVCVCVCVCVCVWSANSTISGCYICWTKPHDYQISLKKHLWQRPTDGILPDAWLKVWHFNSIWTGFQQGHGGLL